MGGNGSGATVAPTQAEALLARLEDPQTAAALHQLLDNLPLLALMVSSMEQLLERGEQIADNLNEGWAELRTSLTSTEADLGKTASQLSTLIPALARAAPAIHRVIDSGIVAPEPVQVLSDAAKSIVEGLETAKREDAKVGPIALARSLRDHDVQRGLAYALGVLKAFGRRLPSR